MSVGQVYEDLRRPGRRVKVTWITDRPPSASAAEPRVEIEVIHEAEGTIKPTVGRTHEVWASRLTHGSDYRLIAQSDRA